MMISIRHTTVIAAILCGTTASADVTAQQVWDAWSEQVTMYGQNFSSGEEVMSGDTLTISDVKIEVSDPELSVVALMGDVEFTQNGDGTVSITMPESYPVTLDITSELGEQSVVNLMVEHDAMVLTVSGDPDAMDYDLTADRYAVRIDSLEGEAAQGGNLEIAMFAMLDVTGKYSVREDNLTNIAYEIGMGALDIDVAFTEVQGDGSLSVNGDLADLAMFGNISIPVGLDMMAGEPPFAEGLAAEGGYSFGETSYSMDVDIDNEAVSGAASAESGLINVSFDQDGIAYSGESIDLAMSLLSPSELPFPIEASIARYGFDIAIPLSQSNTPRDVRFAFDLTEMVVGDAIWDLADPQGVLPRDAITIALGLDAQVIPFFDFLDPAQQDAAAMADVPGEIVSATLTQLIVKGAGAEITGEGSFTFDNTDLDTFDGFPRPQGAVNFSIDGVNGLIDNLIQLGLIPEEEAMMPRMMMGMFTTPVGDDMLTSTIEVNEEGHVLANGQRLR